MEYSTERGYLRRHIYFDRTWDRPEPWQAFIERIKYRVFTMLRLTEYEPSQNLLMVEAPAHCQAAEAIDWRPVWNRDYVAAAQASADATTK